MGPDAAAVVLAGGFSRRFGDDDKVLATVGGRPLVCRVVDRVGRVATRVVVSTRPGQRGRLEAALDDGVAFALDDPPDRGPVAGLADALPAVDRPAVAVVAADCPFVDPGLLSALLDRLPADATAVVPEVDGVVRPTQAVYRADALEDACGEALDRGDRSLRGVLDRLDADVVGEDWVYERASPTAFFDVDTRTDLAAARRIARESGDRTTG